MGFNIDPDGPRGPRMGTAWDLDPGRHDVIDFDPKPAPAPEPPVVHGFDDVWTTWHGKPHAFVACACGATFPLERTNDADEAIRKHKAEVGA